MPRMNVQTQREHGYAGMAALIAKYGLPQVQRWRAKGGRPKDVTWAELEASIAAKRTTRGRAASPAPPSKPKPASTAKTDDQEEA